MQGVCAQQCTLEIMLPYAGIIRIRFMGMISATVARAPLPYLFQCRKGINIYGILPNYSSDFMLSRK